MVGWFRVLAGLVGLAVVLTLLPASSPVDGMQVAYAAPVQPLAAAQDQTASGGAVLPMPSQSGIVAERDSLLGSYRVESPPVVLGRVGHSAPADGAVSVGLAPTLSAVLVGADASVTATYEFTVFGAVGMVASSGRGVSNTWTVPAGLLQPGTTYWWAVTGFDATQAVLGSREPRWVFSTGPYVDAGPGVHLSVPAQAAVVATTRPVLEWGFARTVVGVPVVAKVGVWSLDADRKPSAEPVFTSEWAGGDSVEMPPGKLDWDRAYRVEVRVAEQSDTSRVDRQSVSVSDFVTRIGWDQTRVRADGSPQHQQISTGTGGFVTRRVDASVASAGVPLTMVASYRSTDRGDYALGAGWASLLDMGVEVGGDGVVHVRSADGHVETFAPTIAGTYVAARSTSSRVKKVSDTVWEWVEDGNIYTIDPRGVTKIVAANNFETVVNRDGGGRISEIVDTRSGRRLAVIWAGERVVRVEARSGEGSTPVGWDYEYDNNRLVKACAPRGKGQQSCVGYEYADPNNPTSVTTLTDPAGSRVGLRYSFAGQVSEVADPVGGVTRFARTPKLGADGSFQGSSVVVSNGAGQRLYGYRLNADARVVEQLTFGGSSRLSQTWDYDWKGRKLSYQGMDGARHEWRYVGVSPDPRLMTEWRGPDQVIDRRYDYSNGRLVTIWDPRSEHTTTRRVLRRYVFAGDVAGSNVAAGLLLSETDGAGGVTRYEYTRSTPAADGNGYAPDGLVATKTDPGGGVSRYRYRSDGLAVSVTDPLGATTVFGYDDLGRITSQSLSADGSDQTTRLELGDGGEVVSSTGPRVDDPVSGVSRQVKTSTDYDPAGRPTSLTSSNLVTGHSQTQATAYDPAGRIRLNTAADGATTTTIGYGPSGCVAESTDAVGAVTRNECDEFGRITRTVEVGYTNPAEPGPARDVTTSIITYTNAGRVASTTDAAGITRSFDYTPDGMLTRLTRSVAGQDPVIEEVTLHDALGNPVRVEQFPGRPGLSVTAVTEYDTNARQAATWTRVDETATPLGNIPAHTRRTTYGYDAAGRMIRTSLDDGTPQTTRRIDTSTYNLAGLMTASSTGASENAMSTTTYHYDQRGRRIGRTDPRAAAPGDPAWTTRYTYTMADQTATITYPRIQTTQPDATTSTAAPQASFGYDEFGRMVTATDPVGAVSAIEYDAKSQVTKQIRPPTPIAGQPVPLRPETSYTYNPAGQVTSTTTPDGQTIRYTYDSAGNQVAVHAPPLTPGGPVRTSTTTYNDLGLPISSTAPNGTRTTIDYDPWARPVTVTVHADAQARTATTSYDAAGNQTSTTTATGALTRYRYNNLGEPVSLTDPDNRTTSTATDLAGRPTRTRDDLGRTTLTAYNSDGQVTARSLADPGGVVITATQASYDPAGNQLSLRGPLAVGWDASYDALNQLISHGTTPTSTWRFGYDTAGRRTAITDPNRHTTYTSYTPLGQPATTTEPATGPGPLAEREWATSYDLAGNPIHLTEPGGITIARTFDTDDNLRTETGTGPTTAPAQRQFNYDPYGQLAAVNHPQGQQTFTYNGFGELTASAGPAGASTFNYDPDGRLTQRKDPSGTTTLTYTPGSQPATLSTDAGLVQAYRYDPVGRTVGIAINNTLTRTLEYDAADRLTTDTIARPNGEALRKDTVSYDQAGRRDTLTRTPLSLAGAGTNRYSYDTDSRLSTWTDPTGTAHIYTYDPAGNTTNLDGKAATFDARNRLTSLGDTTYTWSPRGTQDTATTNATTTTRTWDSLGRLTSHDATTTYTYDGLDRIATANTQPFTYAGPTPEPARIGATPLTRSIDGTTVLATGTDLLAADPNRNLTDRINTTTATTTGSRSYAPFGETTTTHNEPVAPPGYQGQYTTPTGLTHMQTRWYDATTHTFLSRDNTPNLPTNQQNLYQYAGSDPLTNTDPTGQGWLDEAVCYWTGWWCHTPSTHTAVPAPPKPYPPSGPGYTRPPDTTQGTRGPLTSGKTGNDSAPSNSGSGGRGGHGSSGAGGSGYCKYACSSTNSSGKSSSNSGPSKPTPAPPKPKPTDGYRPIDPKTKHIPGANVPTVAPPEQGYTPLPGGANNTAANNSKIPPVDIPQTMPATNPAPPTQPGNQPGPTTTPVPTTQTPGAGNATTGHGNGDLRLPTIDELRQLPGQINTALRDPNLTTNITHALQNPDLWVDAGLIVASTIAIGAICAGTAGIGCAVIAGAAIGAATAGANYAIKQTIHKQQITATGLTTNILAGGISGALGGTVGYTATKATQAITGQLTKQTVRAANKGPTTLFHYTDEVGQRGILDSGKLNPSLKSLSPKDARYGEGQYLTDIAPGTRTCAQLSACFLGIPFQGRRFTHYVEIDVSGMNIVKGRDGVFVNSSSEPLDITRRLISGGIN